jgi:hypothetical protein
VLAAMAGVSFGRRAAPGYGNWNATLLAVGGFLALVVLAYVAFPASTRSAPGSRPPCCGGSGWPRSAPQGRAVDDLGPVVRRPDRAQPPGPTPPARHRPALGRASRPSAQAGVQLTRASAQPGSRRSRTVSEAGATSTRQNDSTGASSACSTAIRTQPPWVTATVVPDQRWACPRKRETRAHSSPSGSGRSVGQAHSSDQLRSGQLALHQPPWAVQLGAVLPGRVQPSTVKLP